MPILTEKKCSVESCKREARRKGWCKAHYLRILTTGSVRADKPLRRRSLELVDGLQPRSHSLYNTWYGMRQRCYANYTKEYKYYGAKGVVVCSRWRNSFANFVQDMGNKPTKLHQLDRIDVNGNYTPNNCRWSTCAEQVRNRRITKITIEDAEEIRHLYSKGNITQKELGRMYGLRQDNVSRIVNNLLWCKL